MIYVASPYSDPDPAVQHKRYEQALKLTQGLMLRGLPAFSPIVHCHEIALRFSLPGDAKYWQEYNTSFLRKADAMHILEIDGWAASKGIKQEALLAKELNLPVYLVDATGFISTFSGWDLFL